MLVLVPDLDPLRVGLPVDSYSSSITNRDFNRVLKKRLRELAGLTGRILLVLLESIQIISKIIVPRLNMSLPLGEAKSLVAELCRLFYDQGWVSGTGGGISIRASTDEIVMAPSGVQKERMDAEDMFVLNAAGEVVHTPVAKPAPNRAPKLSECSPLFMAVSDASSNAASNTPRPTKTLHTSYVVCTKTLHRQRMQWNFSHPQ